MSAQINIVWLSNSLFALDNIYTTPNNPQDEVDAVNAREDVPGSYCLTDSLMNYPNDKVRPFFDILSEHHCKGQFYHPWEHLKELFEVSRGPVPVPAEAQAAEEEEAPTEESDGLSDEQHIRRKQTRNHWEYLVPHHGKLMRHRIGDEGMEGYSVRYARYDKNKRYGFVGDDGKEYSLSSFGRQHYTAMGRRPSGACCGTTECEIEVSDGVWIYATEIPTEIM